MERIIYAVQQKVSKISVEHLEKKTSMHFSLSDSWVKAIK